MSFESKYSLAITEKSIKNGNYGVPVSTLSKVWSEREQELERRSTPWIDAYTGVQGGTNGQVRPDVWTKGDSFLCKQIGTTVKYKESRVYPSGENKIEKTVGRYSSPLVQSKLRQLKQTVMSEQYLMGDVDYVKDSLDLKKTEITTLPKLKSVGANLTLDADSKLNDLSALKNVGGKLVVIAKNKDDMNQFLQKLGITNDKNEPQIKIKNGIEFVMKNYV